MTNWNKDEISAKLKYIFARNEDPKQTKVYIDILRYIYTRAKLLITFRKKSIEQLKKEGTKRNGEPWTILHYQRITSPEKTPVCIGAYSYVTPKTFEMHCKVLSEIANVISLKQLLTLLDNNQLPPDGTIVITFDGGFSDFYINAANPLLENNLKATIAIATGYIGNKALFLDDMIATGLRLMSAENYALENFESLTPDMMEDLLSTTKDRVPTAKSVQTFLALSLALPLKERLAILNELGEQLKELEFGLPEWNDFLNWEDIYNLNQLGFDFISKLHTNPFPIDLSKEVLSKEINDYKKLFKINSLDASNIISLPYGIFINDFLNNLSEFGIKYGLSSHIPLPIWTQTQEKVKVLSRKLICEGNSFSKDLFLSTIWDL